MGSILIRRHRYQSFWKFLVILQILPQCHTHCTNSSPRITSRQIAVPEININVGGGWESFRKLAKDLHGSCCCGSISVVDGFCCADCLDWQLFTLFGLNYSKPNVISRIWVRHLISIYRQWKKIIPVKWFRAPRLKRSQVGYPFSGFFSNFCYATNCYLRKKI